MIFQKSAISWNQLLQFSIFSGMYYYEATVTDEGLCRVGWATDLASLDLGTMTVNWTSYYNDIVRTNEVHFGASYHHGNG